MLQRSPTYIVSEKDEDRLANWMNKYLPSKMAYQITRWKYIALQLFAFRVSRRFPKFMKKLMIKGVSKELGENYNTEKHFTPNYNPWDQRVCLVPNGDLLKAIKNKTASVVTDHIETFTEKGLLLRSGRELEADIIVTATGLNLQIMGNINLVVDGKKMDLSKTVFYKSVMFSDLPNLAMSLGYTNASWTLKCDLTSKYVCRLLNYMEENGYDQCCPRQNDPSLKLSSAIDFTSGYFQRSIELLPSRGAKGAWRFKQNYLFDIKRLRHSAIQDGIIEFASAEKKPISKMSSDLKQRASQSASNS